MSELFIPSNNNYLHKTIQFSLNNQKHGPDASPFLVHNSINEIICRRDCFVPLTKRTGGGKLNTSGEQTVQRLLGQLCSEPCRPFGCVVRLML
jgi:hypothetical protein